MKTLIIKDLAIAADLDQKAMSAVRGGYSSNMKMSYSIPSMPQYDFTYPTFPTSTSTTTVSVSQANNQVQNNPTGNGSAVFGGGIFAQNNQQGFNSIG